MKQLLVLLISLVLLSGGRVLAVDYTLQMMPDKAFYRPGETVTMSVTASGGSRVEADVTYLAETLITLSAPVQDGRAILMVTPPPAAQRGYGLDARLLDDSGTILATDSSAFDILDRWTQAPRYGFLSQFEPGRDNTGETMAWGARYHINGLQFYDWQYRHEELLPPTHTYTDLLGKQMSLTVVNNLIDAGHAANIAAMPYTAIYGASTAFYEAHMDWALFQYPGHPYSFGDNFLVIMDPTPGSPWADHLLDQFDRVLSQTAFDGIHIDQYGSPKRGLNHDNESVHLDTVFPAFIDQAAAIVNDRRGADGAVIFNAVGNWPVDTVAPSDEDAVYIEVWEPYHQFMDLFRLVTRAQELGGRKPVIIAAYIAPERIHNVRLADALIFASGGYHLELGEPGAMLADPYFPKFGMMDDAAQHVMRRYYDFLVRYENVLALNTTDATGERADALSISGVETQGRSSRDRVAVIVRQGAGCETFSLVNLMGLDQPNWDQPLGNGPSPQDNLAVQIHVSRPVARVWQASPDGEDIAPHLITFVSDEDADGHYVEFTLTHLNYWTMIVLEYAS